jgi:sugar phosphate permease
MVSGIGLGIMITGLLIPAVNNLTADGQGWRTNWMLMGGLVLAIGLLCSLLIRNQPQDLGLQVLEKKRGRKETKQTTLLNKKTNLDGKHSFSEAVAGRFWFWFGLLGMLSGPLFGTLSDRIGRARTLAMVYGLQGFAHLLLALNPMPGSIYLSIGLFALCAWSVPSIMAAAVGDYLGPIQAASGFATVTLFFSVGQISGPALAGILAEKSGSFSQSYLLAGLLAATAALLSLTLPKIKG